MKQQPQTNDTRIAVPTEAGVLAGHFGRCEHFTIFDVRDSKVVYLARLQPPAHEPGVIPQWLSQRGTNVIIAGGMGMRAQQLFNQYGIQVLIGAPPIDPEEIVERFLTGTLLTGENVCDSEHHGHGGDGCGSGHGGGHGSGQGGCAGHGSGHRGGSGR